MSKTEELTIASWLFPILCCSYTKHSVLFFKKRQKHVHGAVRWSKEEHEELWDFSQVKKSPGRKLSSNTKSVVMGVREGVILVLTGCKENYNNDRSHDKTDLVSN